MGAENRADMLAESSSLMLLAVIGYGAALSTTVTIAPGVEMPRVNLGTCCGSKPSVGLEPWLKMGGSGVDTAFDYNDQTDIATVLEQAGVIREQVFITTKIPAGIGASANASQCEADPEVARWYLAQNLAALKVDYVDLVLLHGPCQLAPGIKDPDAANNALWSGLEAALASGSTRSIGVSNYKTAQLQALRGSVPAVNQCEMSVTGSFGQPGHDDDTIAYCQSHNITYESYGALKGCPHDDQRVQAMANTHQVAWSSICLRWILQRGAIVATGTGANASRVSGYAHADLTEPFSFELSEAEMETLNKMQDE